jgi:hypothetical protein
LRKRYADDQEFRQKKIAYASAYYKAHKDEILARRRRRRKADPAYREKLIAATQAYREAHKEEFGERRRRDPMTRRRHRLRCIYGMSLEEYDAMLDRQGGVCAICKKKPDAGKALFVDHCHVTGMVRGLLCGKCNSVLAFGNDDPDILRAAIAYLQAALASEASGQRGNFIVRAHSASEDARERADDPRPEPGSSARAARDHDRNVTAQDRAGESGRAMRLPDIVAAETKPYDSSVT